MRAEVRRRPDCLGRLVFLDTLSNIFTLNVNFDDQLHDPGSFQHCLAILMVKCMQICHAGEAVLAAGKDGAQNFEGMKSSSPLYDILLVLLIAFAARRLLYRHSSER